MKKSSGFLLVTVLFMTTLLLIAGMALLGKQAIDYPESRQASERAQARALAWAGLEDVMAKLEKDISFPPPGAVDQREFSWTETVSDLDGTAAGDYTVRLDMRKAEAHQLIVVESTGWIGSSSNPTAQVTLLAEIDLRSAELTYYRIVNFLER